MAKLDSKNVKIAAQRAKAGDITNNYNYPIQPPSHLPGVVPKDKVAPVVAMDNICGYNYYGTLSQMGGAYCRGFPGFPYLSQLSTRAEYRAFAEALSTEITREWIKFDSKHDDTTLAGEKIKVIEEEFKRLDIRGIIKLAVEHDAYFGRCHMFIDIDGNDRELPLILSPETIRKGSLRRISNVEPIWTTPAMYNALDPSAPDFYKPTKWFMLGKQVHSSRLYTVVTRELPDMLKPAYDFAGISMSQLAEPYVDNWLRTRQSVSDLINNFSITALATAMDEIFQNGLPQESSIFARAELFTATRSNKGLMLLDKDREDLLQINTPLGGLHELQAQAQEHMCSVSRMPAIVLTGISPSGLNASSDGEIRIFYDWIASNQEANWRKPIEIFMQLVQLSKFGEIDSDIGFHFVQLYQMTDKELSEIRKADADTSTAYINAGVIDPEEARKRLANDPESGYMDLDLNKVIEPPNSGIEDPFGFGGTLKPEEEPSDVDETGNNPAGEKKPNPFRDKMGAN